MKYRRLYSDELAELETEFVRFLAANGLAGADWERLKAEQPERTEALIADFSDLVFDKVLQKVEYLEWKQPHDLRTYHCLSDRLVMNGLLIEGQTSFDFTQNLGPEQMIGMLQVSGARLKLYSGERAYREDRERELFELMEAGALISKDGGLFRVLEELKQR